ncbi:hypothetical protein CFBP1573P_02822 [Pseudomonas syringae pv. persicae]|uniref:Uncharacterized protein n=1 Tax=Pseudomonas syringae pv. persicae TaxID=237306 RepID=A0AB38EGP9_9PSED|nr:hypothetical protein NCPPB2254_02570 [Pseudomonas syringae pv. persicae]SOQ10042.1 hypothetical protein CFBP1573P_02822 [Pseudomonas syringae pv. persicae]
MRFSLSFNAPLALFFVILIVFICIYLMVDK